MATPDQVIQHVKFALEGLSERNAHHEFEHACRHLARYRIAFNLLPATGPVAAGGDRGRDFETFPTFVGGIVEGKFSAETPNAKLAFACSLDRQVSRKGRDDVAKIMARQPSPDVIYFFSSRPVPIAQRQSLQDWAKSDHNVRLELLDREAIAELLVDAEVFWIAARYLAIPLEVFPVSTEPESEYERLKKKWFGNGAKVERYAEFIEIKRAARNALVHAKSDLTIWIRLLAEFEGIVTNAHERRQVTYEILALTMRQTRSLVGQEERIRTFFSDIERLSPDELENAETIRTYTTTAVKMHEASIANEELDRWRDSLRKVINAGIASPASTNQLCHFLRLRGRFALHEELFRGRPLDLSEVKADWLELTRKLNNAPVFPLEDFHNELLEIEALLESNPIFDDVLLELRPLLSDRAGAAAVAESHFDRAEQFFNTNQTLRSLRELHQARLLWFSEATLGPSTLCCLLVARSYRRLGLNFAAMYYALVAGFICANSTDDTLRSRVHEAIHDAAEAAFLQGHRCLFFEFIPGALAIQHHTSPEGLDVEKSIRLQWLVENLPIALHLTKELNPDVFDTAWRRIVEWGFESVASERMPWFAEALAKRETANLGEHLHRMFVGPPYSDAGGHCEVLWSALGVEWRFRWVNGYAEFRVAAEVVAFFQMAVAELGGTDLDVVPGKFLADIDLTDDDQFAAERVPDNELYRWQFKIPRSIVPGTGGVESFRTAMLKTTLQIIRGISVMQNEQFFGVVEKEMAPRLLAQDFFARRFPELLDFFGCNQRFGLIGRVNFTSAIATEGWHSMCPPVLEWVNTIHPRFNEAEELKRIEQRYSVGLDGLRFTLPRVVNNPDFRRRMDILRAQGWKDWHLLLAMLNAAANYRATLKLGANADIQEFQKGLKAEVFSAETAERPEVPVDQFSVSALKMFLLMATCSALEAESLELHQQTPNIDGLFKYAGARWRYFDLDVTHPRIFDAAHR